MKFPSNPIIAVAFLLLAGCHSLPTPEDYTAEYFEEIRGQSVELRHFFQQMPKGGDLHHHYSGSVYPETYVELIVKHNFWIDTISYEIKSPDDVPKSKSGWTRCKPLSQKPTWKNHRLELLYRWSVLDYTALRGPSDEHFFNAFGEFWSVVPISFSVALPLMKARAMKENMIYLETQLRSIPGLTNYGYEGDWSDSLHAALSSQDSLAILHILDTLSQSYEQDSSGFGKAVEDHNLFIDSLHQALALDDDNFTIRYLNYTARVVPDPVATFRQLVACFQSANASDLILGVNFVGPEHYTASMQQYWLHMQMFAFLHRKYPNVNITLHAGELTLGLVRPENLTWHINSAIHIGHANRIGHGVDIAYEQHSEALLEHMKKEGIAVEINPVSNSFILGVEGDRHPFLLYHEAEVPLVISTDDAGILRTDLTAQYVKLAEQYDPISYYDFKKFAFNSIRYSFMSEEDKARVLTKLQADFTAFEDVVYQQQFRN